MDTGTRNRCLDDLYAGRKAVPCLWCLRGVKRHKATIEHVQPRCLGGGDDIDNLDVACRKCNTSRNHSSWVPRRAPLMLQPDKNPRILKRKWGVCLHCVVNKPDHCTRCGGSPRAEKKGDGIYVPARKW